MRTSLTFLGALGVLAVQVFTSPAIAKDRPPHPRQAEIDSLFRAAQQAMDARNASAALPLLQQVTNIDPKNDRACLKTGDACLTLKDRVGAEKAFRKALSIRLSPEAYDGIGRVLMEGNRGQVGQAIEYFRDALTRNWDYYEAHFHIAQAEWKLKELDAKKAMDEALKRNPDDTRLYLLLAEWYQAPPPDLLRAIQWYERYLQRRPDDTEIAHRLGDLYLRNKQFDKARDQAAAQFASHPDRVPELAVLALSCLGQGDLLKADSLFAAYLDRIDPTERGYYEDIRFVATPPEIQAYQSQADPEARREFLRRFWAVRNPTPTDDANRRLLEHYRRVYVARTRFSEWQKPWDRRGEVYIRYGEPDFRARSDEVNFQHTLDPHVERIKQDMRAAIYGPSVQYPNTELSLEKPYSGADHNFDKITNDASLMWGPVYPIRTIASFTTESSGHGSLQETREDIKASGDVSTHAENQVPWETWTYFNLGGGIEITFTDERGYGRYDYAPIPFDTPNKGADVRLVTYAPQTILEKTAAKTPELFRQETPGRLVFAACPAAFRGQNGRTRVEVYTGVPLSEVGYAQKDAGRVASLERRIALLDTAWRDAGRMRGDLAFADSLTAGVGQGAFLLGVRAFDVDPGDYLLAVQMTDRTTGRMQAYRQNLRVDRFGPDGLQVSDLLLAAQIVPDAGASPLVKNGLRILPMPSRTFGGDQGLFLYCEVYNLKRDAMGQTRYRVDYTVRSKEEMIGANLFTALGRLIHKDQKKGETTVSYEFVGMRPDAFINLELGVRDIGPGDYALRVTVTDLNGNAKAGRETAFWIKK